MIIPQAQLNQTQMSKPYFQAVARSSPALAGQERRAEAGSLQNQHGFANWHRNSVAPFLPAPSRPQPTHMALGRNTFRTCVSPIVVLHGGGCEERIMAGGPHALEGLLSCVQLHVVVQRPLLREAPVTQVTCKFPGWAREEELKGRTRTERAQDGVFNPERGKCTALREENCRLGLSCLYNQALILLSRPGTSAIYSLLCGWAQRV